MTTIEEVRLRNMVDAAKLRDDIRTGRMDAFGAVSILAAFSFKCLRARCWALVLWPWQLWLKNPDPRAAALALQDWLDEYAPY